MNQVNDDIHIKVLRNGNIHEIPKREIVVGDIVVLETGEEIPADGELIEAISLQVNESTLTGEPVIDKTTDPADFDPEATYPSNKIMRGTTIVNGHCVYKVEKVGDATEFGKVAQNLQRSITIKLRSANNWKAWPSLSVLSVLQLPGLLLSDYLQKIL